MTNLARSMPANRKMPRTQRTSSTWRRLFTWIASFVVLAVGLYLLVLWPWISRWGATREEVQQTLPGDELIPNPGLVTTKAITIHAPAEAIWPWLMQMGIDRGGLYSYLWVENWLLRLRVQNSNEIRPEWQTLQVGDFIRFTPKEYALNPGPGLYIMQLEPNRALAGCFGMEGSPPDCTQSATWQFILESAGDQATRLVLRSRSADPGSALANNAAKFAQAFQFYMERKMVLGIKQRAEAHPVAYSSQQVTVS